MFLDADEAIARHGLVSHPEGGHYREVYRSLQSVGIPEGYPGPRVALTVIYFLLANGEFSAFHRVRGEEVWVHLDGGALELVLLEPDLRIHRLASAKNGGAPLLVIPPGVLQAARTLGDSALVACLVAPGFEFADFEVPPRAELLRRHPEHNDLVRQLTR